MIHLAKPFIGQEEETAVLEVLRSGMLATGKVVTQLEEDFSRMFGYKHVVATSSGTSALQAALYAYGVKEGDEVLTTPFTFIATANTILSFGARPVFVDIDEKTFNMDPKQLQAKLTPKTVGIMPVHLYGYPCDMDMISEFAKKHNLFIVEDACQAHGAKYKGKYVGSWGAAAFSLYPTKNMTSGEGGLMTTNDDKVAEKARLYINHGQKERYVHTEFGLNFRLTNIHAAIGVEQLKKLSGFTKKRQQNAKLLSTGLKGVNLPYCSSDCEHVYHQYAIQVKRNRNELIDALTKEGIGTGVHYPKPINQQPFYMSMGYDRVTFPVSERVSQQVLSLPVHPQVTKEELNFIVETVNRLVKECNCA